MKKYSLFFAIVFFLACIFGCFITVRISRNIAKNSQKPTYTQALTLWQVDMIEGGIGSRQSFFKKLGNEFYKKSGIYIDVQVHTKYSCEENLKKGIYPDMISYSYGLDGIAPLAKEIKIDNADGVYINKKLYAINFAIGGYFLISKKQNIIGSGDVLYVSQNTATMPMVAYYLSGLNFKKVIDNRPIDAYNCFVSQNNAYLLGTQRDIYRLKKRNIEFYYKQLSSFSDLKYFVSILSGDSYNSCLDFVKMLCFEKQDLVSTLGLMCANFENKTEIDYDPEKLEKANKVYGYPDFKAIQKLNQELYESNKTLDEKLNTIKNILK